MTSVHTEVWRSNTTDWLSQLELIVQAKQINNLLVSPDTWCGRAIHTASGMPELLAYEQVIEDWKQQLFEQVDASFTSTMGGIAETGSLVLWPDKDEPRLMSLVPSIHIALLESGKIENTFLSFMKKHAWVGRGMPANALLISGPSKTADIEQTLAYGVHGPKELVVIII
jgi:L-lactate dehydrogenase complex protein LldG